MSSLEGALCSRILFLLIVVLFISDDFYVDAAPPVGANSAPIHRLLGWCISHVDDHNYVLWWTSLYYLVHLEPRFSAAAFLQLVSVRVARVKSGGLGAGSPQARRRRRSTRR